MGDTAKAKVEMPAADVFVSAQEQHLFAALASGKDVDYLSLFLAADSTFATPAHIAEIRKLVADFVTTNGVSPNVGSKGLKKLYTDIHNAFLSKYVDNPSFSQMFKSGDYNCATASALYALLLDTLSVSYVIRETPQHVYIVAAPQTHNIVFETTTPGARVWQISDKVKEQYLEYMYSNKMISKEEWALADKDQLFAKYYYDDDGINKRQLAGLLYYNKGVEAANAENHREAYRNFEKAYFLYPSSRIKYFVAYALANVLFDKGVKEQPGAYQLYLRLMQVSNPEVGKSLLADYLDAITKKLLFQSPDPGKYFLIQNAIASSLPNDEFKESVQHDHYYNSAHYYSIKHNWDTSLRYLDSAYKMNTNDLLVQELITGTVLEMMQTITEENKAADSLEHMFRRYPFIDKKSRLGEYYAFCLSKVAAQYYLKDKKKEGDQYLTVIKDLMTREPELTKKAETYFTGAFFEVYSYHMRHSQYKEAKAFLLSINNFYPENEELKRRMKTINGILQ